jgi:hypothetical protein
LWLARAKEEAKFLSSAQKQSFSLTNVNEHLNRNSDKSNNSLSTSTLKAKLGQQEAREQSALELRHRTPPTLRLHFIHTEFQKGQECENAAKLANLKRRFPWLGSLKLLQILSLSCPRPLRSSSGALGSLGSLGTCLILILIFLYIYGTYYIHQGHPWKHGNTMKFSLGLG